MAYGVGSSKVPAYLKFIHSHTCLVHATGPVHAHHLVARGMGSSQKGSDYTCVPLCAMCHNEIHTLGLRKFEEKYRANLYKDALTLIIEWLQR